MVLPEDSQKTAVEAYNTQRWDCVAVRSSAPGEDGVDILLPVCTKRVGCSQCVGTKKAISTCRKSSQSERVLSYRTLHNLEDTPVAVIVQEMIEGEVSGLCSHTTRSIQMLRSFPTGYGLGEGVVQGITPCDTIRVQGRSVEREIAVKDTALRLRGTATTEFAIEEERQERCCLSEDQSLRLAKEGRRLAEAFGRPLDIEWTLRECLLFASGATHYAGFAVWSEIAVGQRQHHRVLLWVDVTADLFVRFASITVYRLFCQVMGCQSAGSASILLSSPE